jgi:hypothetical protein
MFLTPVPTEILDGEGYGFLVGDFAALEEQFLREAPG